METLITIVGYFIIAGFAIVIIGIGIIVIRDIKTEVKRKGN